MGSGTWFLILLLITVVGPYVLGVSPRTVRDWRAVTVAVCFTIWILIGMAVLKSL